MDEYQKLFNDIFKNSMIIIAFAGAFLWVRVLIIKWNLKFPEDEKKVVGEEIIIEKFNSKIMKNAENKKDIKNMKKNMFCNNIGMAKKCGKFKRKSECTSVECCVFAKNKNGTNCVPGNAMGPTMRKDKQLVNYDSFYYMKKKLKKL
tara:strand:+ start:2368 stop:2808 length:441 start_codon:yes stop_codon:yes gene_type:complete